MKDFSHIRPLSVVSGMRQYKFKASRHDGALMLMALSSLLKTSKSKHKQSLRALFLPLYISRTFHSSEMEFFVPW